jgi:peptidoglycan/xylan/chitin deacetylase (PgdA/CDA1 family)
VSTPVATFSLLATNPTAVPLSVINSLQSSSATIPLATTEVPGTTPTFLPGAPPLPNAALLAPSSYPPLDKLPDISSPEVQQWIAEVNATGIEIPNLNPTNPGGCPNNTAAAADQTRCWWTCGGCVRTTDVTECPTKYEWGLTYDDGPSYYTPNLLQFLDANSLKSTFFVVGSRVISFPATLQTQYMGQHQIAVHTWSHPPLTTLTNEEIIAELGWSKKVIKDVLGVTPNMMRPPYGDIDDRVRAISLAMGLTPVMWTRISPLATFDTDDFDIHGGLTTVQQVLQNWENILGNVSVINTGFIVLEHDLFEQTVEVATGYILPDALAHQPPFDIQPVIKCLNKDLADAYVETNNNATNPPAFSAAVSAGAVTTTASPAGSTGGASGGGSSKSAGVSVQFSGFTSLVGLVVGGALSMRL